MPLDELVKEIVDDAEKTVSAIRKSGSEEAGKITDDAKKSAKEIMTKGKEEAESAVDKMEKQQQASLDVERKMLSIQAREEAIERELGGVKKAVASELKKKSMKKILDNAYENFCVNVPKDQIILTTNKANAKLVDKLGCEVKYDSDVDGFLLQSKDRKITLNAEIERIVESHVNIIRNMLSDRLF